MVNNFLNKLFHILCHCKMPGIFIYFKTQKKWSINDLNTQSNST